MKNPFLVLLLFFVFNVVTSGLAQEKDTLHTAESQISLNGFGTNAQMPFWLRANQYNTAPASSGGSLILGRKSLKSLGNKSVWQLGYGANVVVNLTSSKNQLILPELYGNVKYKKWEFYVGRKKETFGLADTTLGSGSFIWSGNALPMPKVQLSISEYLPLKFTKNRISIKGTYAHGWFGASQFAYDYFLHQKSFYVRWGRKSSMVRFYGGINHQAQWGGKTTGDLTTVTNRIFPSAFGDYLEAVIAIGPNIGLKRRGKNNFDSTNRIGNHLGTIDLGLEIDLKKYNILLYRQSIYEDGSLFYLTSLQDGLNGIVLTNLFPTREKGKISLKKVVFELLNTRNQGGTVFIIGDNQRRGKDDYFNHQQYYDGWSYQRRIIGTPFITNQYDTNRPEIQNTNDIANNNRVLVFHAGFEAYLGSNIHFLSKLSYSANYGTYGYPYPTIPKQFSGLFQLSGQIDAWNGLMWNVALAIDNGGLYQDSVGGRIGIAKVWNHKR